MDNLPRHSGNIWLSYRILPPLMLGVGDTGQRSILFDIDLAIQSLRPRVGDDDAALIALTGSYHNLLRLWGAAGCR